MAFCHWWLTLALQRNEADALRTHLREAGAAARADSAGEAVLARWRACPECLFDAQPRPLDEYPFACLFNWACDREAHAHLGERLLRGELAECRLRIDADTTLDLLIQRHCTPVSAIFAATFLYSYWMTDSELVRNWL